MAIFKETLDLQSDEGITSYIDITEKIKDIVKRSNITNGLVSVISPHTTCAVFYEEFSHDIDENGLDFLQLDLNNGLEKIFPKHTSASTYNYPGEEHYRAVESWGNIDEYLPNGDRRYLWNGDAHLKATIIGSSETFDITNEEVTLGSTGYIYFVDFDITRPRERKCLITVFGE